MALTIRYPDALPITARKDEIVATIRDHQVVVLAGETGSGKSTQLPKMCLELGRGVDGKLIGHTQPRRLAARTVAERVAEELGTTIGGLVGYTVRFTDKVGDQTMVKVMTDGILLAEIQRDPMLRRYDTLIIDEAHERSLNIDFILGYLRQLLPRRPDLKVVITSATIDTARFAAHFGDAPIIEVSGRTYPVDIRYQPIVEDESDRGRDQTEAICDAVVELGAEGPGDVLVFLSGEREIRDTADALRALELRNTELLPLYARLSAAEQHRAFQPHTGRRVVLATNVAETSLTVPGIRYVVDAGTARISRYNRRTKVQRLPIEPVSRAAADQRAGRCGRVAPGICIRLYAEDDYLGRPEFTEPEILRTNLASVILQMESLGLGEVADFPFVDPPDARSVKDGVALLEELGALDPGRPAGSRLTRVGRQLAQLPVDPRLGRMVLEADREACVREVLVVAAALSIQDPRERPTGKQQAADELHRRFTDPESDFVTYLNLWHHLRARQRELSSNQFRRMCRDEYLNHLRVREWMDVHSQLRQVAGTLGVRVGTEPAAPDAVHRALLSGLLSHIGLKDDDRPEYLGARNARFAVARASAVSRKLPKWVMAAELVETNRLWARTVARVQPAWIERAARHLVQRSYGEPYWDRARGAVMAREHVSLYGLPLVADRQVGYARVDPTLARSMFIDNALVEGDWPAPHAFLAHNAALVDEVLALEARSRRRDLLVDDDVIYDFYDRRVPAGVASGPQFDRWWKATRQAEPTLLDLDLGTLTSPAASGVSLADFPDVWPLASGDLALTYTYAPATDADGVTVHIPLGRLNDVRPAGFEWHVPGMRAEVVAALVRGLPRPVRRHFVPVNDHVAAFVAERDPDDGPLLDVLATFLSKRVGVAVRPEDFDPGALPPHLRLTFAVEDRGETIDTDKDLAALRRRMQSKLRAAVAEAGRAIERPPATSWVFGEIPRTVEVERGDHRVRGFPTLVDQGEGVALRVVPTEVEQAESMWAGTRRLLQLGIPSQTKSLSKRLPREATLALTYAPHDSTRALVDDCVVATLDRLLRSHHGPVWDESAFESLRDEVARRLPDLLLSVVKTVAAILAAARAVEQRADALASPGLLDSLTDARVQLARLVYPGFVTATGVERLTDVHRYVRGIGRRLEVMPADPRRDRDRMARVVGLQDRLERLPRGPARDDIRWMVEELRVSVFAQALGTAFPVSEQRVERAIAEVGK